MNAYIIGALHFSPMIGYTGYSNYETILSKAKKDLKSFETGGLYTVLLENNYNFPHQATRETDEAVEMMTALVKDLMKDSDSQFGISVLFNDYTSALRIAKETGGKFIRVPVFVDSVNTIFGTIYARPDEVIKTRQNLDAGDVKIYADIHVKHAEMLNPAKTIEESALEAVAKGADGIIITGRITGDPPKLNDLKRSRKIASTVPILIGSGADRNNIEQLFMFSDGAIVSSSLKEGNPVEGERNVKPFDYHIDRAKVRDFIEMVKKIQDQPR